MTNIWVLIIIYYTGQTEMAYYGSKTECLVYLKERIITEYKNNKRLIEEINCFNKIK